MCSNHWPVHVDMTRDEAKRVLRRLELEAYASLVSALRARGDLTPDKKKILQDVQQTLSISTERHRAEVRRAVNDEKLSTIAQHMNAHNTNAEWLIEGRRLVPLMPRLVPQTAFTPTANNAAIGQAEKNQNLPSPALTGKDIYAPPPPSTPTSTPLQRPQSPPNNVVVLPSGMSIHIKGGLSTEEDDTHPQTKRRRRSSSADSLIITKTTSPVISMTTPRVPAPQGYMGAVTTPTSQQPAVRVTVAKSPGKLHVQGTQQKVVVVSSAPAAAPSAVSPSMPNIIHRPYTRPLPQTPLSPRPGTQPVPFPSPRRDSRDSQPVSQSHSQPHMYPGTQTQTHTPQAQLPRAVAVTSMTSQYPRTVAVTTTIASNYPRTVAVTSQGPRTVAATSVTSQYQRPVPMTTSVTSAVGMKLLDHIVSLTTSSNAMTSQQGSVMAPQVLTTAAHRMYPRTRTTIITRPRAPLHAGPRSTIVIPPGGQPMHSPQIYRAAKSNVHIKQEGSMKIITQAVGPSAKILPKPSSSAGSRLPSDTHSGSTVVVVTTVPSSVAMAARSSITASGGKIVSMGGTRVISASGSKHVQITAVKTSHPGSTVPTPTGTRVVTTPAGKPNVIVVQKGGPTRKLLTSLNQPASSQSQVAMSQTVVTPKTPPSATQLQSGFEKDYISFIEKQGTQPCFSQSSRPVVTQQQKIERRLAPRVETLSTSTQQHKMTVIRQKTDGTTTSQPMVITASHVNKPSILTELIGSRSTPRDQRERIEIVSEDSQAAGTITSVTQKDNLVQNPWVEMDAGMDQSKAATPNTSDSSAIRALLDLQQGTKVRPKAEQPRTAGEVITLDDSGQIVEQAVEESVDGTQYIKTDQGTIKLNATQSGGIITETGQSVQIEIASEEELTQIANTAVSQEIIGELDPNTGILYTSQMLDGQQIIAGGEISSITPLRASEGQPGGITFTDPVTSAAERTVTGKTVVQQHIINRSMLRDDTTRDVTSSDDDVVVVSSRDVTPTTQTNDFLSSALNQADIDLQPYQFMEEDEPTQKPSGQETDDSRSLVQTDEADLSFSTASETETAEIQTPSQVVSMSEEIQLPKPTIIKVPISTQRKETPGERETAEIQTSMLGSYSQNPQVTSQSGFSEQVIEESTEQIRDETVISDRPEVQSEGGQDVQASESTSDENETDPAAVNEEYTVRIESVGMSQVRMSDLTSQRVETEPDSTYQMVTGYIPATSGTSSQESLQEGLAKRKRKPPARADDSEGHVPPWARQALLLLQKIARYRGMYKQKGDIPAASWFTQPVDPEEVPDYYAIISHPMDFSTIRKKLETNEYSGWEEFDADMMLVRENCYAYNPEGTEVRLDCDEVFTFYKQEYSKTMERWSQSHVTSPTSKKPRLDRGPLMSHTAFDFF